MERLDWLAERLRTDPVEGTALDQHGDEQAVVVDETFLAWNLMWTTQGLYVSLSEIGAAASALETGDEAPLLRLAAEHAPRGLEDEGPVKVYSAALSWARYCTDVNSFAWDKSTDFATRSQAFEDARDDLPDDTFAPFSVEGWLAPLPDGFFGPDPCIRWPAPDGPVEPWDEGSFSGDVPALILSGDLDLDTPTGEAEQIEAAWPGSELIEFVDGDHTVVTTGRSQCAISILRRFIKNFETSDTSCASSPDDISLPAVGRFPELAADALPAEIRNAGKDESTENDRKVATVAAAAVTDAFRRFFSQRRGVKGPGLRGGTFKQGPGTPSSVAIVLKNAAFAEDVAVSGDGVYDFGTQAVKAEIDVDGPGPHDGGLRIKGVWFSFGLPPTVLRISGEIDGREVSLEVPSG